ncbi:MAG TPA: hypothetical protein VFQ45_03520 [Longimicrobium sp.]|nr:hypothetical protein [Longimicrobium sp.]
MKKLKLDLEALQVDSFSTAAEGVGPDGTVYGHVSMPVTGCPVQFVPGQIKKTHPMHCPPTSLHTCGAQYTCDHTCAINTQCVSFESCPGTCPMQNTCHQTCGLDCGIDITITIERPK